MTLSYLRQKGKENYTPHRATKESGRYHIQRMAHLESTHRRDGALNGIKGRVNPSGLEKIANQPIKK